jgi:hypothetical protein
LDDYSSISDLKANSLSFGWKLEYSYVKTVPLFVKIYIKFYY